MSMTELVTIFFLFVCLAGKKRKKQQMKQNNSQIEWYSSKDMEVGLCLSEKKVKMYPINSEGMAISIEKTNLFIMQIGRVHSNFFFPLKSS